MKLFEKKTKEKQNYHKSVQSSNYVNFNLIQVYLPNQLNSDVKTLHRLKAFPKLYRFTI